VRVSSYCPAVRPGVVEHFVVVVVVVFTERRG
jgi:hypothetical protein